ncbi:hypothetical protein [Spirillospora sp. CA-294931]|uniref:hypothetical protein n=1 Tax=Spirillospora sp. CA-294931 TaxID=3240042 RepID=UPI003D91FCC9
MTSPDPLGVQIGAREIYDEVKSARDEVRAVGSKVDRLVDGHDGLRSDIDDVRTDLADHETRIRSVERARWPLPSLGVLLALGALIAAVIPLLSKGA